MTIGMMRRCLGEAERAVGQMDCLMGCGVQSAEEDVLADGVVERFRLAVAEVERFLELRARAVFNWGDSWIESERYRGVV